MICAVCNCECLQASSYRLGDLTGEVCTDCQAGLSDAVRRFVVRRTREARRIATLDRRAENKARWQASSDDWARWKAERRADRDARAALKVTREMYPRGLRLVKGARS